MTLDPHEAREALAEELAVEKRRLNRTNQVMSLLLVGLGFAVVYLGSTALHLATHRLWFWLGLLLGLAIVGATAMVSRSDRHHDRFFSLHYLAALGISLVLLVVFALLDANTRPTGASMALRCLLFLVAPVVEALSLMVVGRRPRH